MKHMRNLRCSVCGTNYPSQKITYDCPIDGGNLDVILDHSELAKHWSPPKISSNPDRSLWRYQPLLPVDGPPRNSNTLQTVGGTPFFYADRIAHRVGLQHVWIKDDGRLPTGSLKDRASALVVTYAMEHGIDKIITGMAAGSGLQAVVVAPENVPAAKMAQILVYGAQLVLVRGSYSDAFELTLTASRDLGWYCRNTGYNPLTAEGKKTAAFEICEQLQAACNPGTKMNRWLAPDRVFVPVGDGNIISGLHKGFSDLLQLGWIDQMPRLTGVQAEGSAAIATAFHAGSEDIGHVTATTVADSLASDRPSDGHRAIKAARDTKGDYVVVTDAAILAAMAELSRDTGVFAEPAAAATYAGLLQMAKKDVIMPHEHVVLLITGHGLKDPEAALNIGGNTKTIEPNLSDLREVLD